MPLFEPTFSPFFLELSICLFQYKLSISLFFNLPVILTPTSYQLTSETKLEGWKQNNPFRSVCACRGTAGIREICEESCNKNISACVSQESVVSKDTDKTVKFE